MQRYPETGRERKPVVISLMERKFQATRALLALRETFGDRLCDGDDSYSRLRDMLEAIERAPAFDHEFSPQHLQGLRDRLRATLNQDDYKQQMHENVLDDLLQAARSGHYELLDEADHDALKSAITNRAMLSPPNARFVIRDILDARGAIILNLFGDMLPTFLKDRLPLAKASEASTEAALVQRLSPGRQLAHYADIQRLQSANNKTIFTALASNGKKVVLKKHTLIDTSSRKNALTELRLLYKFSHEPGVINVESYFVQEVSSEIPGQFCDALFLQLPFFEHDTLKAFSDSLRGSVPNGTERLRQLAPVYEEVARVLQVLHLQGVVHRDVKPSNVLIKYDFTNSPQPVLADFEIGKDDARRDTTSTTSQNVALGTTGFRPPEVISGHPDFGMRPTSAHDIWSLGMMLLAEMTGDFHPSTREVTVHSNCRAGRPCFHDVVQKEALLPCEQQLALVIEKMLEYYPADRPRANELEGEIVCALQKEAEVRCCS